MKTSENKRMGRGLAAQKAWISILLAVACLAALALSACNRAHMSAPGEPPIATAQPTASVVEMQDEPQAMPIYRVEPIDANVVNVLLIGTDSRATHGALVGGNADTVILASYNKTSQTITLVSFLRDAVVTVGSLDGAYNKLKAAYRLGGTGLLINTLNSFFALDVQSYAAIGLEGFAAFIDETLGGLDVKLGAAEIAEINARIQNYENESALVKNCPIITDPPGLIHLNGAQTLIFVRNRTTSADGTGEPGNDYDRAARQQEVLQLMYRELVAKAPLSSVPGVIRFALGHVETNMDADAIYRLAEPLMTQKVTVQTVTVPFDGTWQYGGDGSGILFNREETIERLHAALYPQP